MLELQVATIIPHPNSTMVTPKWDLFLVSNSLKNKIMNQIKIGRIFMRGNLPNKFQEQEIYIQKIHYHRFYSPKS
jgi:hypothetical protein